MRDFSTPIPQEILNIQEKTRSNLFSWRGQFSPQLIESLLTAYCSPGSVVLDPFAGSGTVLYEAATLSLPAFGFEINPSAWSFSKLYEFATASSEKREEAISELRTKIDHEFPPAFFLEEIELKEDEFQETVARIGESLGDSAKIIFNSLVVLLDIYKNRISCDLIQSRFGTLTSLIRQLPYSDRPIKADLQDARALPLQDQSVDFAVTSPPYLNVFNYHQNYRRSVEVLGWDPLRVARSEIGSNRANRGNRFYTVIQYCIDMGSVIQELARVLRTGGRAVLILGHQSKVLGTPLCNADIVERLACESEMFRLSLRQQRSFKNRYGEAIREDILNLEKETYRDDNDLPAALGRDTARCLLNTAVKNVPKRNESLLFDAISRIDQIAGTPIFNSSCYPQYQTRDAVMLVKEREST